MGKKFWQKGEETSKTGSSKEVSDTSKSNNKAYDKWLDDKSDLMEVALGQQHEDVLYPIIGGGIGGPLDGHYYPNGIDGVGLATKQLTNLDGTGASNDIYDAYEFVVFTRENIIGSALSDDPEDTHFKMRSLLTSLAPHALETTLNPYETIGFPDEWEEMAGRCIIMDAYKPECFSPKFGLMLLMEIFPSELEFKTQRGGDMLIAILKDEGHYPYSDLNRKPVA